MNQAEVSKLVSQLRIKVNPRLRKFRNPKGPEERLNKLRKTVTALVKHERIELNYPRADEARMYAERLISDAIRYGDCHKTTMEMADYWLVEKQLVHKLFKVLVPRFENSTTCYTRLLKAPKPYPGDQYKKAVLELKGNPYPSLLPDTHTNRNLIHNVLLDEARKAYRLKKYKEIASKIDAAEVKIREAGSKKTDVTVEDGKSNVESKKEAEGSDKKESADSDSVR
ncbi:39S ribosomal protein L17, mitochondrial [Anoplophora glabripennis]|uniref:39S ribosomal protein L17, mitochondrial n=1 Tax=Anoplophora glabripennis TaxID=217634 RepID=UPI000873B008|nr:39S ribosomal protein L17, mitochondrial [Anoplophora glabripennis]